VTRYRGLIDASLIGCSTPVDTETTHLTFLFTVRNADQDEHTANIAKAFVRSVTREVGQDIPIWEAKRYLERPALAPGERPIADWRRWFSQFYADADVTLDASSTANLGSAQPRREGEDQR
jgi:hypothetical protein